MGHAVLSMVAHVSLQNRCNSFVNVSGTAFYNVLLRRNSMSAKHVFPPSSAAARGVISESTHAALAVLTTVGHSFSPRQLLMPSQVGELSMHVVFIATPLRSAFAQACCQVPVFGVVTVQ